jgi:capsular polysaccharide biosynthesis protein
MMTSKVKESMISKSIEAVNIRLAEPASRPTSPFKPKKARNILLGIIFGLVTGIGFAFFLEYLDQTVRNSDDIKRDFEFPVLSVIQDVSKEKRWT